MAQNEAKMEPSKLTPAGRKMLKNFLELEAGIKPAGRWPDFYSLNMVDVLVNGVPTRGMVLPAGDGGAKATAKRLEKDGFAIVRWNTQRILVITEAGRAAVIL
jgi:hypothetical protein